MRILHILTAKTRNHFFVYFSSKGHSRLGLRLLGETFFAKFEHVNLVLDQLFFEQIQRVGVKLLAFHNFKQFSKNAPNIRYFQIEKFIQFHLVQHLSNKHNLGKHELVWTHSKQLLEWVKVTSHDWPTTSPADCTDPRAKFYHQFDV